MGRVGLGFLGIFISIVWSFCILLTVIHSLFWRSFIFWCFLTHGMLHDTYSLLLFAFLIDSYNWTPSLKIT